MENLSDQNVCGYDAVRDAVRNAVRDSFGLVTALAVCVLAKHGREREHRTARGA
jgi:hypothetical protein